MRQTQMLSRHPVSSTSVSRINFFPVLACWIAFSFGFFMQFDVMTSTLGLPFMRLTDGLLFLFIPCLFVMVGPGNTLRHGLMYFVVLFVLISGTLVFKTGIDQGDKYLTLILLATSVFSFYFAFVAQDERVFNYFSVGLVAGLIPSVVVLFLQASGDASLTKIGLGVPAESLPAGAALLGTVKIGGLWAAGNEAGHVYAIAVGAALYLAIKFRRPMIYIAPYVLLVASFTATLNRAGTHRGDPGAGLLLRAPGKFLSVRENRGLGRRCDCYSRQYDKHFRVGQLL